MGLRRNIVRKNEKMRRNKVKWEDERSRWKNYSEIDKPEMANK